MYKIFRKTFEKVCEYMCEYIYNIYANYQFLITFAGIKDGDNDGGGIFIFDEPPMVLSTQNTYSTRSIIKK